MMARVATAAIGSMTFNAAARRFSERAIKLDDRSTAPEFGTPQFDELAGDIQAMSLAAVVSSYMAVEAILNELFMEFELYGRPGVLFPGVRPEVARALNDSWNSGADRWPIVTKCHVAAATFNIAPLDFGQGVAQQFGLLRRLRDELVHHKPMQVEHGKPVASSDDSLERALHGRFDRARIWEGRGVAFRWADCLGAGCARWAHATSTGFQQELFARLGVAYPGAVKLQEPGATS